MSGLETEQTAVASCTMSSSGCIFKCGGQGGEKSKVGMQGKYGQILS